MENTIKAMEKYVAHLESVITNPKATQIEKQRAIIRLDAKDGARDVLAKSKERQSIHAPGTP